MNNFIDFGYGLYNIKSLCVTKAKNVGDGRYILCFYQYGNMVHALYFNTEKERDKEYNRILTLIIKGGY